jgi:hypothetical protein
LIGDSDHRRLQATDNSVTVAYDVTNIPDTATATVIQTQFSTTDSNAKLLNNYKAFDGSTTAAAMTTTVTNAPTVPPSKSSKSSPVGAIAGAVIGVVVAAAIAYIAWRKRAACITRRKPKKHSTTTITDMAPVASVSATEFKDSDGSVSQALLIADNARRNSSYRQSGSLLIDSDSANDVTGDDIEHGTTGTTRIIDDAIDDTDKFIQAPSTSTTANDTTVTSKQHETSVLGVSDITDTTVDTASSMTAADTDSTSDIATSSSRALVVFPTSNEPLVTGSSELAIVTGRPSWTNKVGQSSRLVADRMSIVTQKAVAQHGDKVVLAYGLVGAVAEHIPYVRHAYGLCNEIVELFGAGAHIDSNCAEVVAWARDMQVHHHISVLCYMLDMCSCISHHCDEHANVVDKKYQAH